MGSPSVGGVKWYLLSQLPIRLPGLLQLLEFGIRGRMMTLPIDEGKQLLSLCRVGKLYEIEAWILAGKSLHIPEELRTTPLRVAIGLGFYSLIQLLAIHEDSEAILNDALGAAVDLRSLELVQLLLKDGAQIRGVPLISVLRSWDPEAALGGHLAQVEELRLRMLIER